MRITCIDFETANQNRGSACSVGIACIEDNVITESKEWLLKPRKGYGFFLPAFTEECHGLTWFDVQNANEFDIVYQELKTYLEDAVLVMHNSKFDISVLRSLLNLYELPYPRCSHFCTLKATRRVWPEFADHKLDTLCKQLDHSFNHHHAGEDALATAQLLLAMQNKCSVKTLPDLSATLQIPLESF